MTFAFFAAFLPGRIARIATAFWLAMLIVGCWLLWDYSPTYFRYLLI